MIKAGTYTIRNKVNNKYYVGSSKRTISKRLYEHKWALRHNRHPNKYLQATFNKYGEENFEFEELELCDPEYCISTEQYWINMLNVCNPKLGYNIESKAGGVSTGVNNANHGSKWSKEKRFLMEDHKCNKPVIQMDRNGEIIDIYKSIHEASRLTKIGITNISSVVNGKQKATSKGKYIWKFV